MINILLESLDDIYVKYYQDGENHIDRDEFEDIIRIDPTFISERDNLGRYGQWLLRLITKYHQTIDDHDAQEFTDQLEIFDSHKAGYAPADRDIGKIKSLSELIELNHKYDAENTSIQSLKAGSFPGLELIGQSSNWEVYCPHTYEASKHIRGDNAVWCTGMANNPKFFNNYVNDRKLNLIVFINKTNRDDKYQGAFTSDGDCQEFADHENNHLGFASFVVTNKDIMQILSRSKYSSIINKATGDIKNIEQIQNSVENGFLLLDNKLVDFVLHYSDKILLNSNIKAIKFVSNNEEDLFIKLSASSIKNLVNKLQIFSICIVEEINDVTDFKIWDKIRVFTKIYLPRNSVLRCYDWQKEYLKRSAIFY